MYYKHDFMDELYFIMINFVKLYVKRVLFDLNKIDGHKLIIFEI